MNALEKIFPLSCLFVSLVLFTPIFGLNQSLLVALAIHLWSYLILGLFFEIPELSLNAWCLHLARDPVILRQHFPFLKKIFKVRYFLTHIVVSIDRNGDLFINDRTTSIDSFELNLRGILTIQGKNSIHIKGDQDMPYKYFVQIMDLARQAGATQINIVHQKESMP